MKKTYAWLWLLFAGALLLVTVLSYADDLILGPYKIKKAPIATTLASNPTGASLDTVAIKAFKSAQLLVNPVDSAPQVFLLFGDSMTLKLAYRLNDYAERNGHEMFAVNWDSSTVAKWAASNKLDNAIAEHKPTMVFICLGSNELFVENPNYMKPQIEKILAKIGDVPFVWIGPPNWKKDNGLNDMLEAYLPTGSYFRTEGMVLERGDDHIHPTEQASIVWMDSIMSWTRKSIHPILNAKPLKRADKKWKGIKVYGPNDRGGEQAPSKAKAEPAKKVQPAEKNVPAKQSEAAKPAPQQSKSDAQEKHEEAPAEKHTENPVSEG